MSILVGRDTRLVVQGITGREGGFHAQASLDYGTNVVAGVTPGKGGQRALDDAVPVFDTVAEAVRETGANTSLIFVPAAGAPDAVMEAADARASPRSSASPRGSRRSTWSRPSRSSASAAPASSAPTAPAPPRPGGPRSGSSRARSTARAGSGS